MNWWEILWEHKWIAYAVEKKQSILWDVELKLSKEEKEDLISDMLISVFKRLEKFNYNPEKAKLSTVIWKSFTWAYMDCMRRKFRKQTVYFDPVTVEAYDECAE